MAAGECGGRGNEGVHHVVIRVEKGGGLEGCGGLEGAWLVRNGKHWVVRSEKGRRGEERWGKR